MDFLVTEGPQIDVPLVTESLNEETYPGLQVYEMTDAQREAVRIARAEHLNKTHLSPITSEDDEEETEESESEVEDDIESIPESKVIPVSAAPPSEPRHEITTLPTPNIFSKINDNSILEELKLEVSQLRKKVALSVNMKSLINKLDGVEDLTGQMEVIRSYSKRKFNIIIQLEDFEALTSDQVYSIYKKTRESEKSDKFELIYKTAFEFGVSTLERLLNKYVFKIEKLSEYLIYEDVSLELNDMKSLIESTVVGKYVDHTSPLVKVISHIIIQVTRAKLNM